MLFNSTLNMNGSKRTVYVVVSDLLNTQGTFGDISYLCLFAVYWLRQGVFVILHYCITFYSDKSGLVFFLMEFFSFFIAYRSSVRVLVFPWCHTCPSLWMSYCVLMGHF